VYEYQALITKVVDGDTVHAEIDLGFNVTIAATLRLLGINTPERGQPGGSEATEWLRSKTLNVTVRCLTIKDRREKYGRYLAKLYLPGEDASVNEQLLAAGHAVEYRGAQLR
jgi:micrococcal nuclease